MAILPSGLETIDYGTQGWNAIVSDNMQLLDSKLVNVMTAAKILGSATIVNESTTVADPDVQTSTSITDNSGGSIRNAVWAISGTGDDAHINDNFATIVDRINRMVTCIGSIRTALVATIDYCDALKVKINALLAELRKSTGNGVLGG